MTSQILKTLKMNKIALYITLLTQYRTPRTTDSNYDKFNSKFNRIQFPKIDYFYCKASFPNPRAYEPLVNQIIFIGIE